MTPKEKRLAAMAQGALTAQRHARCDALFRAANEGLLRLENRAGDYDGRAVVVGDVMLGRYRDDPGEELMAKVALALHVLYGRDGFPQPPPHEKRT